MLGRLLRTHFVDQEDGSATIETVILLPVFLLALALVIDTSMIFYGQSHMLRIVQDTNRSAALGRLRSAGEAEAFLASAISRVSPSATTSAVFNNGVITSTVTVPASDLQILGTLAAFDGLAVTVSSQHVLEF